MMNGLSQEKSIGIPVFTTQRTPEVLDGVSTSESDSFGTSLVAGAATLAAPLTQRTGASALREATAAVLELLTARGALAAPSSDEEREDRPGGSVASSYHRQLGAAARATTCMTAASRRYSSTMFAFKPKPRGQIRRCGQQA